MLRSIASVLRIFALMSLGSRRDARAGPSGRQIAPRRVTSCTSFFSPFIGLSYDTQRDYNDWHSDTVVIGSTGRIGRDYGREIDDKIEVKLRTNTKRTLL